jgi:hypothetical protein
MARVPKDVSEWLAKQGAIGGKSRSLAKKRASRENGKLGGSLGGRPRTYPKCPRYSAHRFGPAGKCPCGFVRAS